MFYRIVKTLERLELRGSTRLHRILLRSGRLNKAVDFSIGNGLRVAVPIWRNPYDQQDLDTYEDDFLVMLSKMIQDLPAPVTFLDLGADIGLFSLKLFSKAPSIARIVAFEPNGEGFPWLKLNLERLRIPVQPIHAAAADFEGRGKLTAPEARWIPGMETSHTQFFLEPSDNGPIQVMTIDSLLSAKSDSGGLVIKIDVEGGELAALRGAAKTIAAAAGVVVAIEAHPSVTARTGVDTVECLRWLASVRPFEFLVGETGQALNTEQPVFSQIPPTQVYNLIARSC